MLCGNILNYYQIGKGVFRTMDDKGKQFRLYFVLLLDRGGARFFLWASPITFWTSDEPLRRGGRQRNGSE